MDANSLGHYVTTLFAREDDVLEFIQAETVRNDMPQISLRAEEGRILQLLVMAVGARKAVEIGTLAGYSGTWIARALPADGVLYTLEMSEKHAEVAQANFARAGLSKKVEIMQGPALASLEALSVQGPFDFVFIDADKGGYPAYLEWAIENLRVGGMLAAHNALRGGAVINPQSEEDQSMDAFNRSIASHPRLEGTVLTIGDGTAIAIKRR